MRGLIRHFEGTQGLLPSSDGALCWCRPWRWRPDLSWWANLGDEDSSRFGWSPGVFNAIVAVPVDVEGGSHCAMAKRWSRVISRAHGRPHGSSSDGLCGISFTSANLGLGGRLTATASLAGVSLTYVSCWFVVGVPRVGVAPLACCVVSYSGQRNSFPPEAQF